MMELIPVLARLTKHNEVEVCELKDTIHGIGVPSRAVFFMLGKVMVSKIRTEIRGDMRIASQWVWLSEGYSGRCATKAEAVQAMLDDAGYMQVTIEQTISPLF
jgi:hypothetical protein